MISKYNYGDIADNDILLRCEIKTSVEDIVTEIIAKVRENKDSALFEYCERFDKISLDSLEVSEEEFLEAESLVEEKFKNVIKRASENIYKFHSAQVRQSFVINDSDGVVMGQKIIPIEKVGLYVPGGTAAYPSSVLMNCIPAKIAGCSQIVMVTPPSRDGRVNPHILVAARIAGVDKVFKVGGAQAIAALAYGTESIPAVDKIVGPGNAFVAEAKKQVFGKVAIDMIAGPSEILVVADSTCNPKYVAADLLSQAEHDRLSTAVLVTDSELLADSVSDELERQIPLLSRCEIARESIDTNGKIIITQSIDEAIEVANRIAPEHLEICVDEPFMYLDKIKNAGSVFMGKYCPEALGDYMAGPNHTLPTSGTARFSSPLSVDDFVKKTQFSYFTRSALEKLSKDVEYFADKEGLGAHAKSAVIRFEED